MALITLITIQIFTKQSHKIIQLKKITPNKISQCMCYPYLCDYVFNHIPHCWSFKKHDCVSNAQQEIHLRAKFILYNL